MSSQIPFLQEQVPPVAITTAPTHRVRENIPESSGPFYFYSPGERIPVHDEHFGFAFFEPGIITPLEDQERWALAVYVENPTKQRWTRDPFTGRDIDEERVYKIPASANRLSAIEKYGPGINGFPPGDSNHGLIEITSFSERKARDLGVSAFNAPFNKRICPVVFDILHVPEFLQKDVIEYGGLEVRRQFVLEAREYFASDIFANRDGTPELQKLYLSAISEILNGFEYYKYFANGYLDASDKAVQKGDKKEYDERDYRMMWLLNRKGVDTALSRALTQNQGLTPEAITALVQGIQSGNQPTAMPTPEFIATVVAETMKAMQAEVINVSESPAPVVEEKPKGKVNKDKPME